MPPINGIFSITITLAPFSAAVAAADKPAPPAPITITSASFLVTSVFFSPIGGISAFNLDGSAPACLMQSEIADFNEALVTVAPEIVSTDNV